MAEQPRIGMIWAQTVAGEIGKDGDMPWHLPEDLARFKKVTLGKPVIMGRRTWQSLPERFRPLPGRQNIVLTSDASFEAQGATIASSLQDALDQVQGSAPQNSGYIENSSVESAANDVSTYEVDVWILGGGEIYNLAMPLASVLSVTQIFVEVDGADTFAPKISEDWQLAVEGRMLQSSTGLHYKFESYLKN